MLLLASHRLGNTIGLAGVDGLAGLLDLLEDGGVVDALVGLDGGGLGVEGDVEFFDACEGRVCQHENNYVARREKGKTEEKICPMRSTYHQAS